MRKYANFKIVIIVEVILLIAIAAVLYALGLDRELPRAILTVGFLVVVLPTALCRLYVKIINKFMNRKWYLFSSIIQLAVGLAAIIAFIYLAIKGEIMTKWIAALVLAIAFAILGIVGILDYRKER